MAVAAKTRKAATSTKTRTATTAKVALESLKEKGLLASYQPQTEVRKAKPAPSKNDMKAAKEKARVLDMIAQGTREVKMAMAEKRDM